MNTFDFSKYPETQKLIESTGLTKEAERITFLNMTRQEASIELATLSILLEGAVSANLPMRKLVNEEGDRIYHRVGSNIHAFAKTQARIECRLADEDVVRLYKHIELGGSRYL
ncbi:hypothetical protein [Aneurinibacillus tyrosinisolvens]|uniref:hypothetical protein n=1 Tax=Aneurinibacillus tyrosinisolvens TaxID=1443435 RepID=UPI00063F31CF|nr:hypothetical protein [Aneurinibacillus tyrosinisolvens]